VIQLERTLFRMKYDAKLLGYLVYVCSILLAKCIFLIDGRAETGSGLEKKSGTEKKEEK